MTVADRQLIEWLHARGVCGGMAIGWLMLKARNPERAAQISKKVVRECEEQLDKLRAWRAHELALAVAK